MASKLIVLLVVLLTVHCSLAKEERGFVSTIISNSLNAGKAIATNASATIAQSTNANEAAAKEAFQNGIAKLTEDFNNFKEKSAAMISAAIEQAKNVTNDIQSKMDDAAQKFNSGIERAIESANKSIQEEVELAKQRGADFSKCVSDYNANVSDIADSSETEFQDCEEPYVSPVLNTTSHFGELKMISAQICPDHALMLLECASKFDLSCSSEAIKDAYNRHTNINSQIASDLKNLLSQSLLAEGAIASCATSSAMEAGDKVNDAAGEAIECLRNISK